MVCNSITLIDSACIDIQSTESFYKDGDIQVTRDLAEVFQAGYDLSITVADPRTTIPARVLAVHLQSKYFIYIESVTHS